MPFSVRDHLSQLSIHVYSGHVLLIEGLVQNYCNYLILYKMLQ